MCMCVSVLYPGKKHSEVQRPCYVCVSVCCTLVKSTPRYKDHAMCVSVLCCTLAKSIPDTKTMLRVSVCYAKSIPDTKTMLRVSVCCAVPWQKAFWIQRPCYVCVCWKKHSGYKDHITCVSVLCCNWQKAFRGVNITLWVSCAVLYLGEK